MKFNNFLRKFLKILAIVSIIISSFIVVYVIIKLRENYSYDSSYEGLVCLIKLFEPFKMIFTNTIIIIAAYIASNQNYLTNQSNRNEAYLRWSDKLDVILQSKSDQLKFKIAAQSKEIYEYLLKLNFKATEKSLKNFINTFLSKNDINTIVRYQDNSGDLESQKEAFFKEFWKLIRELMNTGKSNTDLYYWFCEYLSKKIVPDKQV